MLDTDSQYNVYFVEQIYFVRIQQFIEIIEFFFHNLLVISGSPGLPASWFRLNEEVCCYYMY